MVYSQYYFLDEKKRVFNQGDRNQHLRMRHNLILYILGKIIITTLEAIPTEGLTLDDLEDLMDRTHSAMSKVFDEANKEVHQICS